MSRLIRTLPTQAVLASLVASLMAAHAVLGCCWHHGQACSHGDERAAAVVDLDHESEHACPDHAACQNHATDAPAGSDERPCSHPCQTVCKFLPAERVQIDAKVAANFVSGFEPTRVGGMLADPCFAARDARPAGRLSSLHRLRQLLLI